MYSVKGMERYLMLKDMQRKKENDQIIREKEVFRDGSGFQIKQKTAEKDKDDTSLKYSVNNDSSRISKHKFVNQ